MCSALGRGGSARLTKPPTGQEGRCQARGTTKQPRLTVMTGNTATVPGAASPLAAPSCASLTGWTHHKRANWRLSGRSPQRSCRCVTVEAHPLPFKHQDNTLSAAPARRRRSCRRSCRRADASSPSGGRRTQTVTAVCIFRVFPFFSPWTVDYFKRGRYGGDGCGFCGRTRSSHLFRLDDGARRARVEMGVVFWRGLAFPIRIGQRALQLPWCPSVCGGGRGWSSCWCESEGAGPGVLWGVGRSGKGGARVCECLCARRCACPLVSTVQCHRMKKKKNRSSGTQVSRDCYSSIENRFVTICHMFSGILDLFRHCVHSSAPLLPTALTLKPTS